MTAPTTATPPVSRPATRPETRVALLVAALTSFALVSLLGLAVARAGGAKGAIDDQAPALREWAVARPWTEEPLLLVEWAFGYTGLTAATIALAGWLLLRRRVRAAVLVVGVMWATKELSQYAKALVGRERPAWQDADLFVHSGAFPSAHASTVAAFGGLVLVLTFLGSTRPATRRLVGAAVAAVVLLVCADRLLLGRHYPTDLLGGVILAAGVLLLGLAILHPLSGRRGDQEVPEAGRGATPAGDAPSRELVTVSRPA